MENSMQLKVIAALLGLWGLARVVTSAMVVNSSAQLNTILIGADIITGLILLTGSIGLFLKKQFGLYAGVLGILLVLGVNIYSFALGTGGNVIALLVVVLIGYYLYESREVI